MKKLLFIVPNLQTHCHFKLDFPKVLCFIASTFYKLYCDLSAWPIYDSFNYLLLWITTTALKLILINFLMSWQQYVVVLWTKLHPHYVPTSVSTNSYTHTDIFYICIYKYH